MGRISDWRMAEAEGLLLVKLADAGLYVINRIHCGFCEYSVNLVQLGRLQEVQECQLAEMAGEAIDKLERPCPLFRNLLR